MTVDTEVRERWLHWYCHHEMDLLPIWEVGSDGRCACPDPGCDRRNWGKHPRGIGDWGSAATHELDRVLAWHRLWPTCNWAWVLRRHFVLDNDPRNGGLPADTFFDDWKELLGFALPRTLVQSTGGAGLHVVFRQPAVGEVRNSPRLYHGGRRLGGVEIKGVGGYVLIEPSNHVAAFHPELMGTGRYTWAPWTDANDPPPELLTLRLRGRSGNGVDRTNESPNEGGDWEAFDWSEATAVGAILPGEQNTTLHRAAWSCRARRLSDSAALLLLRQVVDAFTLGDVGDPWTHQHAAEMWERVKDEYDRLTPEVETPAYRPRLRLIVNGDVDEAPTPDAVVETRPRAGAPVASNRNTDRANAEDFVASFENRVVWTPNEGWLVWTDRHWQRDKLQVVRRLGAALADVLLTRRAGVAEEDRDRLLSRALRLESIAGVNAMLAYAEHMVARPITDFDRSPWLLNCPNGTLDLRTLQLRDHDPLDLITRLCPTNFVAEARDSTWERFLETALPEDERGALQRFVGSCLTGVVRDKAFLVPTGPKHTGKSTATEPVLRVLGDVDEDGYATTWDEQVIQRGTRVNRDEKANKARAARLVVVGELTRGSRFEDSFVKRITGGDTIDARALYRDSYSYRPQFKLIMHSNFVPKSSDPALHARLKLLPFQHIYDDRSDDVKSYLETDPAAQEAILAWAVEGCRLWQAQGLGEMAWLEEMLHSYALDSDQVLAFMAELLEETDVEAEFVDPSSMWLTYEAWAFQGGEKPMGRRAFERALEERGLLRTRVWLAGHRVMRWSRHRLRHLGHES